MQRPATARKATCLCKRQSSHRGGRSKVLREGQGWVSLDWKGPVDGGKVSAC
jgi:hypothetical protein